MKVTKTPCLANSSAAFLRLTLLIGIAGGSAPGITADMTDSQREQLKAVVPETRIYIAPLPRPLKVSPVSAEAQIPARAHERVRLLQGGVLIERETAFQATVTLAHAALIEFSNTYGVGLRLPDGHGFALAAGQKVAVRYKPVTTQGALESVLTVLSDDVKGGQGSLILQVVQRGGGELVAIQNRDFTVAQVRAETPVLETVTDRTSRVDAVVRVTGVRQPIGLTEGKPTGFEAGGRNYIITLVKSLHVVNLAEHLSVEGPPYYLEYVVTLGPG